VLYRLIVMIFFCPVFHAREWQFKVIVGGEGKIAVNHKHLTDIAKVCGAFTLQWTTPT